MKRKVFAIAKSVYEIDIGFYKMFNVKTLLIDLDNTLDSYKLFHPTEKAFELINNLRKNDIEPIIISNNRGKRVSCYANDLKVEFIHSAMKPSGHKLNKFIESKNLDRNELMFVGDQMITDVGAANRANIRVVLTDKIVKEDQWTTRFNRIFGRMIRKKLAKQGKLIEWRTLYGKNEKSA